jgi:hypothetical protein
VSFREKASQTAIILAIAIGFALLAGLWEGLPQSTDQPKHNLILADLIEREWPVRYPGADGGEYLCYGLGYYMVPSTLARVFGTSSAGAVTFIWATLGLFLFFLGLGGLFRKHPLTGIALFLLCSGLGMFWLVIKSGIIHEIAPTGSIPAADPSLFLNLGLYTTNLDPSTRIFYQPQHGIAGWLGGMLLYELLLVRKQWTESAAVLAAICFWSPITAAALGVIVVAALATKFRTVVFRPAIHLVSACAVMAVLSAYYLPHLSIAEKGFIWDLAADNSWVVWYGVFVFLFILLQAGAIFWLDWKQPFLGTLKPVVIGMTVLLVACPLYKLGNFGDLRMQVSGPAFLFIAIAMVLGLLRGPVPGSLPPWIFLCGVFLAGAMSPIIRTPANMISAPKADYRIPALRKKGLSGITDLRMTGFDVTTQYLGKSRANTAEWILKNPDKP